MPEVGRALQSEAVASPGAFANGTGGGGIVQATYLEAAADQFKAIAAEHEAALEAAARLEAEEKAYTGCRDYEHGGAKVPCGTWPGAGGAEEFEIEDPTGHHLYSASETLALAAELRSDATNGDLIATVLTLLPYVGPAFASVGAYTSYLNVWAHNLENCALAVGSSGRCWVTVTTWRLKNPIRTLVVPISGAEEPCAWTGRILYTDVYRCENGVLRRHNE